MVGDVVVGIADEELVERVRRGDAHAFRVLVDRHRAWLTARCRRHLGGDAHAAEDVAQECLVALQRTVVGGDKPLRVRPWLSVVARNRCIDETRKLRAVPTSSVPETAVFDAEAGTEDPHLIRAWSALTGRHRTVLELRELGGLSYEEIAVTLAVTAGAVETLLFRARTALRREYARAGGKVAAMAPMQEAVAQAAGHRGALSRLAEGAGEGIDGVASLVGGRSGQLAAAADGSSTVAGTNSSSSAWIADLQARLATSPAFEPAVQAGAGGGRVRMALAAVAALLGTVAVTVPAMDSASTAPPASPPAATVPPAPSADAGDQPTTPTTPEAPEAPEQEAPAPPSPTDPRGVPDAAAAASTTLVPPVLDGVTEPMSPVLDGAATTVTSIVDDAVDPLGLLLDEVSPLRRR